MIDEYLEYLLAQYPGWVLAPKRVYEDMWQESSLHEIAHAMDLGLLPERWVGEYAPDDSRIDMVADAITSCEADSQAAGHEIGEATFALESRALAISMGLSWALGAPIPFETILHGVARNLAYPWDLLPPIYDRLVARVRADLCTRQVHRCIRQALRLYPPAKRLRLPRGGKPLLEAITQSRMLSW